MKQFLMVLIFLPLFAFSQQDSLDYVKALRHMIKVALKDKSYKQIITNKPIGDKQTAIEVAELILFESYGKDHIIGERPYNIYHADGYWVMSGSLPEGYVGGTFFIILRARDGRVMFLTHYK